VPSATIIVITLTDTAPPTVPTGLGASAITGEGFTITWNQSTDDSGSVVYEVFLGGASQGTVTATAMPITGLQPATEYSVSIRAGDLSGNWSALSEALEVATLVAPPEAYSISAGLNTVALPPVSGRCSNW
jgi:chitodextrinase